jgi:hypothetical protein
LGRSTVSRTIVVPKNHRIESAETTRAPTWSWAAWDGPIRHPLLLKMFEQSTDLEKRCEALSFKPRCDFVCLGDTEGSQVSWLNDTGTLTLRGRLLPINLSVQGQSGQIGPGFLRKANPHDDFKTGLPRLALADFVAIRSLQNPDDWDQPCGCWR